MKEITLKKSTFLIGFSLPIVSWILGGIFANVIRTEISIPIGIILINLPFIAFLQFVAILAIKNVAKEIRENNNKQKKQKKYINSITINIFCSIACIMFLFFSIFPILQCYSSVLDLINGPKEIIIYNAQVVKRRTGGKHKRTHYYLTGKLSTNESKSIFIRQRKNKKEILRKLEKSNKVKVYYFEKLNEIYKLK